MPLPSCECNNGLPIQQQLANIYCALKEIADGGGGSGSAPILGEIKLISGPTVPALWLSADGSAVSRATYADYFALVGTTYGAGNGTTTFNVPDARARALVAPAAGSGRLTATTMTSVAAGGTGGAEGITLTANNVPPLTVAGSDGWSNPGNNGIACGDDGGSNVTITGAANSGSTSTAHNNVQPTLIVGGAIVYVGV